MIPLHSPSEQPGWHLQVVAIASSHQHNGLAAEVFATTFTRMREYGPERDLVTAVVHKQHRVSWHAAEKAGLIYICDRDERYAVLLGDLMQLSPS